MPGTPQRHPSRDQRPTEWENVGSHSIHLHPGGIYDHEELSHAKSFWKSEGDPVEGYHATRPSQGRLFNPDVHEAKVRQELGAKRLPSFDAYGDVAAEARGGEIRDSALASSTVPTSHLQPRQLPGHTEEAPESKFVIERGLIQRGVGGHYTGPVLNQHQTDYVTVDPEGRHLNETTLHEMGHRQHLGMSRVDDPSILHPRKMFPNPVMEAHADAYVDRYGGQDSSHVQEMSKDIEAGLGKFGSYAYTGYSTQYHNPGGEQWSPEDRATYAGTRAHYSETGEVHNYQPARHHPDERPQTRGYNNATIDATLHSLVSNSPHAAQALRQTDLKDVGAAAFRRHRDRQLMNQGQSIQGSLLHDVRTQSGKHVGFTPSFDAVPDFHNWESGFDSDMSRMEDKAGEFVMPQHMSHNQFGETPRTQGDVDRTLGVHRSHSAPRGFPSI